MYEIYGHESVRENKKREGSRSMKKRLALVLAGVMMVSSLAGCGSSKPAETTAAAAGETTAAAADAKADTTEAAKI